MSLDNQPRMKLSCHLIIIINNSKSGAIMPHSYQCVEDYRLIFFLHLLLMLLDESLLDIVRNELVA